jgi:leader peptidase (prepilin peptidase) / N-methyltransferase
MEIYLIFYVLLGLVIGSFLNVCIYRIPLEKSIAFPGSGCPNCNAPIRPYDNIPVLSYLLLRGKCRSCGKPISLQYPIVELLSGLAFYCCAQTWQFTSPTYVNSIFLSLIIVLIFTDYHHQILPNILTIPGAIAGFLLSPFQTTELYADTLSFALASQLGLENSWLVLSWIGALLGAVIGGGSLFAVAFLYEKIRKQQGLGMGDVKLMAMVGAFLGFRLAFLTIFLGSFLGSLVGLYGMLARKMNLQTKLAYGVFLGGAAALSLFYGFFLIDLYFKVGQFLADWFLKIIP